MALKMLGTSEKSTKTVHLKTGGSVAVLEQPVTAPTPTVQHIVPVEATPETETVLDKMVSEYITLWQQCEKLDVKPMLARMEALRKSLVAYANEHMADNKPAVFTSKDGKIEFSERKVDTSIQDAKKLITDLTEKFGEDVAYSVVNIALTPLRKMLGEVELAPYVKQEPGARILKSVQPVSD